MVSAMLLGLEDQGASLVRDLCAEAGSGDSAADDDHVKAIHLPAGYELESRAV